MDIQLQWTDSILELCRTLTRADTEYTDTGNTKNSLV